MKSYLQYLTIFITFSSAHITQASINAQEAQGPQQQTMQKNQTVPTPVLVPSPNATTQSVDKSEKKQISSLEISQAWARKSMSNSSSNNSAAYMKVTNPTEKDIVLMGASSADIANNVELHKSFVDESGVSRMTSVDRIVIPAQSTIELKPGGIHIMLLDLKKKLNIGMKFNIDLQIEGSEPIVTEILVK